MKKILGITLFIFGLLFLGACTEQGTLSLSLSSDEDVFSYQALATSSLLQNQTGDTLVEKESGFTLLSGSQTLETGEDVQEPVEVVEPYLELIEKFMSGEQGFNATVQTSDNLDYEFMILFETSDLLGEAQTYALYYNQVLESEFEDETDDIDEAEETDEVDEEETEDEADEEDDEQEYMITGILVQGNQTFTVEGRKEIEEDEESLEFISYIDELNYVRSEYEVESGETRFSLEEVRNGEVYSESEINIEIEDNEIKVELEQFMNGNEYYYEFKYETEDGEDIIKVEYETFIDGVQQEGEIKAYVVVDELTGETSYVILLDDDKDGEADHEYEKDRDDDDDDDDDEDDEMEDHDDDDEEEEDDSEDSM
ncbi:hypothetical protein BK010_03720 [Tenericutes bacterium MO-XQ]|nr:hypothetical protein BK010_03720 [Tenericutes bacterium MO-XQ]